MLYICFANSSDDSRLIVCTFYLKTKNTLKKCVNSTRMKKRSSFWYEVGRKKMVHIVPADLEQKSLP